MKIDRKKFLLCMARKCMNTASLVEASGLPEGTIKRAMRGGKIRTTTAGKLATALGVDAADIITFCEQD